ncbi:uncharacterized protein CC84DRAFT_429785 [Paraphaeosphaeria sporulosa]|uniref:Arrestin-like N-terminal domain-containing protein n=1 Tax=Paraphaeosphaeria sporulosa TaxID=1460663 RepID=A0A177BW64_9PLEO|nr:uncharacterized protein CC84DRAFT_429785 [Paraphaeosphaeria sporulosa]OAF98569.1 hypothetical protein CC84DRAFT_429785 [Paraphaeosphaeria sporulosa]
MEQQITIELAEGGTIFNVENTINGNVVLRNAKPELIGSIRMVLSGRTKTKIVEKNNRNATYRGRHFLFIQKTVINAESTPLEPGQKYIWPFTIAFPTFLPPPDIRAASVDGSTPPTFRADDISFSVNAKCFVEYMIAAIIFKHQSRVVLHKREKVVKYVPNFPHHQELPPQMDKLWNQKFMARSLLLLPENEGRCLTRREKVKSVFQSSKLPCSAFQFNVSFPTCLLVGHKLRIFTTIAHLSEESTVIRPPQVTLATLSVVLKSRTSLQADGTFHPHNHVQQSTCWTRTWTNDGPFLESENWQQTFDATLPRTLHPTFNTYNISRSYYLKITGILKCANEKFDVKVRGGYIDLHLYPPRLPAVSSEGDGLPTYREAMAIAPPPRLDSDSD